MFAAINLLIIGSCKKEEQVISWDYRDKYTGEWAFKVYYMRTDMFTYTTDSSYYYGTIFKGATETEVVISYGSITMTMNVGKDGKIERTGTSGNSADGAFDTENVFGWGSYRVTNSYRTSTSVYGVKKISSSISGKIPIANTKPATSVTLAGAVLNGVLKQTYTFTNVAFEYGKTSEYGYSVKPKPYVLSDNEDMEFSASVSGLIPNTQYHFRIKADNSAGTSYSEDLTFTTGDIPPPVTDIDGNVYNTVQIGTQTWMAENLRTTRYADGTPIELISNTDGWTLQSSSSKGFCYYNDDISNAKKYGAYYNWAAAMNGANESWLNPSGVQGVCPTGWHMPSEPEWNTMEQYVSGKWSKVISQQYGGTNETGFSVIYAGMRNGIFYYVGSQAFFWTTSPYPTNNQIYVRSISTYHLFKNVGISVRCVKNNK
jgi:uncharacterized protein (TIGR02145 family)